MSFPNVFRTSRGCCAFANYHKPLLLLGPAYRATANLALCPFRARRLRPIAGSPFRLTLTLAGAHDPLRRLCRPARQLAS